jgi:hypothetical protein
MPFSPARGLGLVLVSVALTACGDQPQSPADASSAPALQSAAAPLSWTIDDEFERIAREEVPGFAGDYLLPDGTPVVRLVNAGHRVAAQRVVNVRRARAGLPPAVIQVRSADFDFIALRGFRDALMPLLEQDRAFAIDIDEANNHVWVAVQSPADAAAVRAAIARQGIPSRAVDVEVQQKPQKRKSLFDHQRPVQGGYFIVYPLGAGCTLGFNAIMNGTPVFVTASHCSAHENRLDTVTQMQPSNDAGYEIGREVRDRGGQTCGFATTLVSCRRADASIYAYGAGVSYDLGRIARTMSYGAGQAGSREIDPLNPYFQITAKNTSGLSVGTWIDKVGSQTGWTRGQVKNSCVWLKDGIYYDCQYIASTWSEQGDSGAPMFVVGSGVTLHGLLWGGPPGHPSTTWYSPVGGIEKDFGVTLQVF